ncbi:hypothetical protein ABB02_01757 [Clostridiaceae bacterium JG1575]|nr:hypothetical protein ABB02_01757 [Clostridiaceae bacterium JG1575]
MLKEKEGIVPILVLTIVALIMATLLAITNAVTKPKIDAAKVSAYKEAMEALMPEANAFENIKGVDVDGVKDIFLCKKGSEPLGYVVIAETQGYGGSLPVITAFKSDKTLAGIFSSKTAETPNYGKKIEEADYQKQFKGMAATQPFTIGSESGATHFDQISGATITSKALKKALNASLKALQGLGY